MFFLDHIWLIPLLPAFGAAIMFFFGRKLQKADGERGLRRRGGAGVCLVVRRGLAIHRTTRTTIRASLSRRSSTPGWAPTPAT